MESVTLGSPVAAELICAVHRHIQEPV